MNEPGNEPVAYSVPEDLMKEIYIALLDASERFEHRAPLIEYCGRELENRFERVRVLGTFKQKGD